MSDSAPREKLLWTVTSSNGNPTMNSTSTLSGSVEPIEFSEQGWGTSTNLPRNKLNYIHT